ncbi:hypothetical protein GCM10010519_06600 [Streptomyces lactacystinicus]
MVGLAFVAAVEAAEAADPTSWLTGYRRLNHRYERDPRNYLAFLGLGATLCCYKRLIRITT